MNTHTKRTLPLTIVCIVSGLSFTISNESFAQTESASGEEMLEAVIVTGARGRPRTVSDSPVPIDVFDSDTIEGVSYTSTAIHAREP